MATTYYDAAVSEVRHGNWRRPEFHLQHFLEALRRRLKILRHAVLWLGDEHAVQLAMHGQRYARPAHRSWSLQPL